MGINKIAVLGVVFPEVTEFFSDYLLSLEKQTRRDFDLILINDGLDKLPDCVNKSDLVIREISFQGSPAQIRAFGINYVATRGYEHLIFTDCDDFFSYNRIDKSTALLNQYDIVTNDLTTVTREGAIIDANYISNRLSNLTSIDARFILDKNIMGFSNTGIRVNCLEKDIEFDSQLIAVDWYFYSKLLKQNKQAVFTNETVTYYRNYSGNIIGLSSNVTREKIEKNIAVKLIHYGVLSKIDAEYELLHAKTKALDEMLRDHHRKNTDIAGLLDSTVEKPLWWESPRITEDLIL